MAYLAVAVYLDKVAASRLVTLSLSRRNIPSSLAKKTTRCAEKISFHLIRERKQIEVWYNLSCGCVLALLSAPSRLGAMQGEMAHQQTTRWRSGLEEKRQYRNHEGMGN
jgi:hypothetical protein